MNDSFSILLLHPDDNVLVCVSPVGAGQVLALGDTALVARQAIGVGHKLARVVLSPGDKVIKYGVPIGSMTAAAAPGDWIHMHNLKSDYIASHTRAAAEIDR